MTATPVRQSFNRAALTYEASAKLQQQVADLLLQAINTTLPAGFSGNVVDAGCGTGYCLTQLQQSYPAATLFGIDFAQAMLHQQCRSPNALRINGDLQHLPLAPASIDLYLSSLAWQWCDIDQALREAARVLKPGGNLWFTTLVSGTFHELDMALRHAGLTPARHLLAAQQAEKIRRAFDGTALVLTHAHCDAITTWHTDFNHLRRSIRGVGANHLPMTRPDPIDRVARQRLLNAYEALRAPAGLPLTYNVLTIHARRT